VKAQTNRNHREYGKKLAGPRGAYTETNKKNKKNNKLEIIKKSQKKYHYFPL